MAHNNTTQHTFLVSFQNTRTPRRFEEGLIISTKEDGHGINRDRLAMGEKKPEKAPHRANLCSRPMDEHGAETCPVQRVWVLCV